MPCAGASATTSRSSVGARRTSSILTGIAGPGQLGYAQLDPTEGDLDVFVGHPVTCDQPEVKLLVSWQEPGVWFVEAHNAGEKPVKAALASNAGWTRFEFKETVELPAGSSKVWRVKER